MIITGCKKLAVELDIGEPTVDLIVKAFLNPHCYDYREGINILNISYNTELCSSPFIGYNKKEWP